MQNFYIEACLSKDGDHILVDKRGNFDDFHWGWESPGNQLRGHFLGHWLSAAAYMYAETGDIRKPESILQREYGQEYKVVRWKQSHYRTTHQPANIRFVPLYEVADERYTLYFPVRRE